LRDFRDVAGTAVHAGVDVRSRNGAVRPFTHAMSRPKKGRANPTSTSGSERIAESD
jgi:hypothetical protein